MLLTFAPLALLWILADANQYAPAAPADPPTTQPMTQPTTPNLRRPVQVEILEQLLREREAPKPILPTKPDAPSDRTLRPDGTVTPGLMLDGAVVVSRPGRLIRNADRSEFTFVTDDVAAGLSSKTLPLLPNQLLEAMEQQAERGVTEFEITAEVTRYRGQNFLLLRKVLRRVSNGNLAP